MKDGFLHRKTFVEKNVVMQKNLNFLKHPFSSTEMFS